MTNNQKEIIKSNLRSYLNNFGYLHIEDENYGDGFYVFTSEDRKERGDYTQYCYNIDYLNGWLYGAVQAVNGIMKSIRPTAKEEEEMLIVAGYREKFAVYNGTCETVYCGVDKHKCYKYTYSEDLEYQDANGALYDTVEKRWRA